MGCFSYMCKECGVPINDMERCIIFFLDKKEVVEIQHGTYDNYGCVHEAMTGKESHSGESWKYKEWGKLVDMQFDNDNSSGFAVYHEACYTGQTPRTRSKDDPNQGWGRAKDYFTEESSITLPEKLQEKYCLWRL